MDKARLTAFILLGAAAGGALGAPAAARRFGRPGRLALTAGVAVLALRDAGMVRGGAPTRLRTAPRYLLYLESIGAVGAALLGAAAWAGASEPAAGCGDLAAKRRASDAAWAADAAAALTFGVHAVRQAIYLTPGQGRLEREHGRAPVVSDD